MDFYQLKKSDLLFSRDIPGVVVEPLILGHHVSGQLLDHLVRLTVLRAEHFAIFCINSTSEARVHLRWMRFLDCGRHRHFVCFLLLLTQQNFLGDLISTFILFKILHESEKIAIKIY